MLTSLRTQFRMVRLLAIAIFTAWLVVILPSPSAAQLSLPALSEFGGTSTTIRNFLNDSYAPYECGRLLCSKVYLYGSDRFPTLTLAEKPQLNPENGQLIPPLLGQRSQWLQDEFTQLVDILNHHRNHQQWGVHPSQAPRPRAPLPLAELARLSRIDNELVPRIFNNRVPLNPHDLHPDTPKVVISKLNQETVLMVPEQLNLTERLLLTVTAADARHNERNIDELAVIWRDIIRLTLSTALAESELLESYALDWLVPLIATWMGVIFVVVMVSGWFRAGCRWWEHRLRRHLRDLQRDLAAESELDTQPVNPDLDATTADLDATDADPANLRTTHLGTTAPHATAADSQTSDSKNSNSQASDSQASDSQASASQSADFQSADFQNSAEVSEHRGRAMTHPAAVALPSHPPRVNKLGKLKSLDQDRTDQNQKDQNQKDQDRRDQDQRQAANGQTLANGQVLGRGQGSGLGQEQLGQEAVARAKGARRASPPISPPRMWGSRWGQRWARSRQQSQALSHNLGHQMHEWVNAISHRNLHRQGWLAQQRNVVQLLALMLRWLQIWMVLYGLGEIIFLFPSLRLYSHLLIPVAIRIPILWMVIGFADKTVDFICDAALNRWARRSSLNDPSSQRYPLRVSTYSPAIHGATTFVANCIGIYFTIRMLNINPAGLASIGAVAVAATFLSRNLIEGILNGTLILWTDRYAVGDAVEIQGEVGIVEDMNLYLTVVRGREGRAIAIPNGQISTVANLSKDWSRVDLRVAIDHEADVEVAKAIIMDISEQLHADPDWGEKVIDPAVIMGVDDLSHFGVTLLIWMKTQPLQHWAVGREFRLRLKQAFAEHNIVLAMPRQAVYYQSSQFPSGLADGDDAGITALDVD